MRALVSLLAIVAIGVVMAACSPDPATSTYDRVTEPELVAGSPIPVPAGGPDLTLAGRIATTNHEDELVLDRATIERIGLVRSVVHDPWLEEELEFTGVLLRDLLDVAGASPDATTLRISALDDYMVRIPIADVERWPIMLATQVAGQPMSVEDKGPTRIIYPAHPDIDLLATKDFWIWQISTIAVE